MFPGSQDPKQPSGGQLGAVSIPGTKMKQEPGYFAGRTNKRPIFHSLPASEDRPRKETNHEHEDDLHHPV
ncbi:hypothetical protein TRIP_B350366 [uncultured Desulfatiglans sp.]|uniref:Uncharacterized protein n=1 Tax=Uncultured Desulfatiglans sp. TaxID=1748965 RepID=A0A653ABP7_UNCDX|nr:hypothetical protein TRIP_B350366 [uncultured Desulfatiglans sp.]